MPGTQGKERGCRQSACWLAMALAAACMMAQARAQSPAWKPDKVVEIIVGTAAGAAPDKTARTIQRIWSWNFLDSAKTAAAVSVYAGEVEALVATLGLRKPQ